MFSTGWLFYNQTYFGLQWPRFYIMAVLGHWNIGIVRYGKLND